MLKLSLEKYRASYVPKVIEDKKNMLKEKLSLYVTTTKVGLYMNAHLGGIVYKIHTVL